MPNQTDSVPACKTETRREQRMRCGESCNDRGGRCGRARLAGVQAGEEGTLLPLYALQQRVDGGQCRALLRHALRRAARQAAYIRMAFVVFTSEVESRITYLGLFHCWKRMHANHL